MLGEGGSRENYFLRRCAAAGGLLLKCALPRESIQQDCGVMGQSLGQHLAHLFRGLAETALKGRFAFKACLQCV